MVFLSANVVERVTIMNSTKHGYKYYEFEDVREICMRCRYGFCYGDWSIQDCSYCRLPKALETIKEQAEVLEELYAKKLF